MIQIGTKAPAFERATAYQNNDFKKISLNEYSGKWVVLFFYPRDFTFVCPTEIREFAKHQAKFSELGAEIIAVSTDSEWSHKNWFESDLPEVKYPVIADTTQEISKAYQVLNAEDGSAERGLFIIDPDGAIKYCLVSWGSVGRSVTETLRVLEALQSGDLCPVQWQAGEQTLGKA
ncbi:MAG: peroxiredoxin [Candidatus Uhrbacteria bacterium]|nr:peroxiredoxin [Candidatus Uhrbacteria bacterium]